MLFDFEAFLSDVDPPQKYEIEVLTGGLVNITVRATKLSTSDEGIFPAHKSLILKYAPPFVAALGESAPFSQGRQVIEARGLSLFTSSSAPLSNIATSSRVNVPKLLHHSPEKHVLILEDLGPLQTLYDYFSSIPDEKNDVSFPDEAVSQDLGSRIGDFFGQMHSPASRAKAGVALSDSQEKALSEDVVYEVAVMTMQKYLPQFNIPDYGKLFSRVEQDYKRSDSESERCFILGDFHPGSILLDSSNCITQFVSVIDWEFAGLGRGPNGDMAQFLAILHLLLMAASPGSWHHTALESFVQALCAKYQEHSSRWLGNLEFVMAGAGKSETHTKEMLERLQIFRSALILHGREMINNAVERDWHSRHKEKGEMVQDMVKMGAWYLKRAGDSVEGMLDHANLEELKKEDGQIILRLFGMVD